jgi:Fe-S cluster biogenesis protein NfuA
MTVASVDAALEEVRPYLMADGGDVAVVGVEAGVVAVALQGACSSCASSSATLKMGIERQLRAVFGEQLLEVVQVRRLAGGVAAYMCALAVQWASQWHRELRVAPAAGCPA